TRLRPTSELLDCFNAPGDYVLVGSEFYCIYLLNPATQLSHYSLSEFDLFRLTTQGPPPAFYAAPEVRGPNEFPNTRIDTDDRPAIAAAVNCTSIPSQIFRFVWS